MNLSSLIDEYRTCEAALYDAIGTEHAARIREYDIRMNWLRRVIRDFKARSVTERLKQVDFFIAPVAQAADLQADNPLFRDLRTVVERYAAPLHDSDEDEGAQAEAGRSHLREHGIDPTTLVPGRTPAASAIAAIEKSELRLSVIDRDMRYAYTSPANGRFYGIPREALIGRHLADLIGARRFEMRARRYIEKCFGGEDQCYYYYLEGEGRGMQLWECRLLHQHETDNSGPGAVILMKDLTGSIPDPVRLAEENRV